MIGILCLFLFLLIFFSVQKMVHNKKLTKGVSLFGRSAMYRRRMLYKRKKPAKTSAAPRTKAPTTKVVPIKGAKNGEKRTVPISHSVSDSMIFCMFVCFLMCTCV